jgi:transcriptional regulator with XRE-family HTH domain
MSREARENQAIRSEESWTEAFLVDFPERLAATRKQRGMTQQALADAVGIHVTQLRRYEGGKAQPTMGVLRDLAVALRVSADALLFEENERGPADDLRLQFEALSRLDEREREIVRELLEGMLIKHDAEQWMRGKQAAGAE